MIKQRRVNLINKIIKVPNNINIVIIRILIWYFDTT